MSRKVRVFTDIPEEDYARLLEALPSGIRAEILRTFVLRAIEAVEDHGIIMVGALTTGAYMLTPRDKK